MISTFILLSSGIFLGWTLGANDAANIFGTAVGTRMIKFRTAAVTGSLFVIIGAVVSGAGASDTLGKLGAVHTLTGAFVVALAAGIAVFIMTKFKLPVSTSQAIVGSIIGWNFYVGVPTDSSSLLKIVLTWVLCPLLAAAFSALFFFIAKLGISRLRISIIRLDAYTRLGLLLVGAFGAYSLGANNIANVMGVFVPISPFQDISFLSFQFSSAQQLFLIGGLSISLGILTYSKKVMETVGNDLYTLSPIAAFIVVLSSSLVLFLFASMPLKLWLMARGLPSFPLVPVSSSQAVVGAVIGIGLARGGRNIKFKVLGKISIGWITTPTSSGIISYMLLFLFSKVIPIV